MVRRLTAYTFNHKAGGPHHTDSIYLKVLGVQVNREMSTAPATTPLLPSVTHPTHSANSNPTHEHEHTTSINYQSSNHVTNNIVHEHDTDHCKAKKHINLRGGEKGRLHGHAEHTRVRVQRIDVDDHSPHRVLPGIQRSTIVHALPPRTPHPSGCPVARMSSFSTPHFSHRGPPVKIAPTTPAGTDAEGRGSRDRYSR